MSGRSKIPESVRAEIGMNGHVPRIAAVAASEVETKPIEWLWRGRIPRGKLTIFDGDPGLGKSVVTMDIAARVSTGRGFPDGSPCAPGNVLILNLEDESADTIVPRLKAHGADLSRVFILPGEVPDEDGKARAVEIPRDLPLLEGAVVEHGAVLLILDPIMTMLSGDANKDQDARKALTPVKEVSGRTGVSVIGVRHLNKSLGLKAIQRGSGNMGLIGVARAGSFFAEHPDDEDLRVMAAHKSNLAEKPPSLAYSLVPWAIDPEIVRVEWKGTTEHDANSISAAPATPAEKTKQEEARDFLRDFLRDGPRWQEEVKQAAHRQLISYATLRIAKGQLRVRSERIGTEGWQWALPEDPEGDKEEGRLTALSPLAPLAPSNPEPPDSPYLGEGAKEAKEAKEAKGASPGTYDYPLPSPDGPPPADVRRIAGVFARVHMHRAVGTNLRAYYEAETGGEKKGTKKALCRVVCMAASLDPERWEEYVGPILGEAEKRRPARQRAEDEKEGAETVGDRPRP